jgi:hypothetical protein
MHGGNTVKFTKYLLMLIKTSNAVWTKKYPTCKILVYPEVQCLEE